MLLHPLGELRRAHQAGLYRDVRKVGHPDELFTTGVRRGQRAKNRDRCIMTSFQVESSGSMG
jgi:hypothetical protein